MKNEEGGMLKKEVGTRVVDISLGEARSVSGRV